MSCAERRERLYDRLYGLLEEGDAAELDRHVAACPDCAREWQALKGRDALLDAWTPAYRPATPIRFGTPRRGPALAWAAAALLVALATTTLFPTSTSYDIAGSPLSVGQKVKTLDAASVRLGRAGRLKLEPGTEILFRRGGPDLDHELELTAGTLHADVFPTGRAFRVVVGERTVEVRGTRFTVRRFGAEELTQVLGEESMKRWNLASTSVALLTVTTGAVVLSGPDGRVPVEAGQSVLATPSGVEKIDAGESLASVRQVRDELLRSLAAREEKNRAMRTELDTLQGKLRKGQLPPGATLESLMSGLRAAIAKGDPQELQQAISLLGLLLEKDDRACAGVLKALRENRDVTLAHALCSALSQGGRVGAHRAEILNLLVDSEIPVDVRTAIVQNLQSSFYGASKVDDAGALLLLRAAKALSGTGEDGASLRTYLAHIALQQLSVPSEAWDEFQRFLAGETDDNVRSAALRTYFWGASRKKGSSAAEGLLLETLRGRYGITALQMQISDPLLPWFSAENADAFTGTLKQAAAQLSEPAQRQAVAGQLGLLYLMQRHPGALDALRQLHAAESDADARSRLGEVLQAADKGSLDLDKLMEKLQLQWNF
jgi:ferric-dicitrate binding protein FerR (iron transport regulator)